jgi:hypothetical protein
VFYCIEEAKDKVKGAYPLVFEPKGGYQESTYSCYSEGVSRPEVPLVLLRADGSRKCDIHVMFHMAGYIVSSRFCDALRRAGCTGWRTYPVVAHDRAGHPLPGYEGLAVLGRASEVDRTQEHRIEVPGPLRHPCTVWTGYDIVPSSWDGSDVFSVHEPPSGVCSAVILSKKAAGALVRAKLEGMAVLPLPRMQREARWIVA